jgi:hypothetical protein
METRGGVRCSLYEYVTALRHMPHLHCIFLISKIRSGKELEEKGQGGKREEERRGKGGKKGKHGHPVVKWLVPLLALEMSCPRRREEEKWRKREERKRERERIPRGGSNSGAIISISNILQLLQLCKNIVSTYLVVP